MKRHLTDGALVLLAGLAMGGFGAGLALLGNPANSGICISCFMENLAGALRLHPNARMAYLRPELVGFVVGAFAMALAFREHRPRYGPFPLLGVAFGFLMVAGSAVFMGCPIKMVLRLAAGDLSAVAGLAGLAAGVWTGTAFLRSGVDLGAPTPSRGRLQGALLPAATAALFAASLAAPGILAAGTSGPAGARAPLAASLGAGLAIGALAQRSRFCVTGSFTNLFLARDGSLMRGLLALFGAALAVNLLGRSFRMGILDQPGAHTDWFWSFLSLSLVGFAAVLAGGCPFRQLVLTGEGSVDASLVVAGMAAGGAAAQAWGIASTSAGPTAAGRTAVLAGLAFCFAVVRSTRRR